MITAQRAPSKSPEQVAIRGDLPSLLEDIADADATGGCGWRSAVASFGIAPSPELRHESRMPTKLLAGLDILVIEDESLLQKQIAAHLESLRADVTAVETLQGRPLIA